MKFVVIDELCCTETYYTDEKEARSDARNIQGTLYRVLDDGTREYILSYGDF